MEKMTGFADTLRRDGAPGQNDLTEEKVLEECKAECRKRIGDVVDRFTRPADSSVSDSPSDSPDESADSSLETEEGKLAFEDEVCGVVMEMLSFVEAGNRKIRMEKQRQGIESAKAEGKRFGREFKFDPLDYVSICRDLEDGIISVKEAKEVIGASNTTILRMRKRLRAEGLL